MMPYYKLLNRLLSINTNGGMKLGLENCRELNKLLDNPVNSFSAIHVAGSNGKGSVVTKIAAALQASGLKVGVYTSPHIACFRERIKINKTMISEEQAAKHLSRLFALVDEHKIPATFFELTTLLACTYFTEENIDIAVVETGLGGRLDATNIIQPILSIITSISLEHTEILGTSIEQIALEKAGIIKPSIPIIIGPNVPALIIEEIAQQHSSRCIVVEGLFDDFSEENKAIASKALHYLNVPLYAIQKGLAQHPPCRLQILEKQDLSKCFLDLCLPDAVILDVAHNPDGISKLIQAVRKRYVNHPIRFVVGLSKNKDLSACLDLLRQSGVHFHLVEANCTRAASKYALCESLTSLGVLPFEMTIETSMPAAIKNSIHFAGIHHQIVVVCGTFFIMAAARAALGIQDMQDPFFMNETL